jgi:micrococcal nuclease
MHTAVVALAALLLVATLGRAVPPAHAEWATAGPAYVTRAVDAETLYVELAGGLEAVRYLGVNGLRIEHPFHGTTPYADVAREANRRLVEGKWIRLVFDGPPRDRFGRLVAYVWSGGLFVNAALVHYGFAETTPGSTAGYAEYFRSLQEGAMRDARGLWRREDTRAYHRPRPAEGTAAATEYEERAADASGGRVFSAPAPFIPLPPPTWSQRSAPSIGVPAAPPAAPAPTPGYTTPRTTMPRTTTPRTTTPR